jgi:RNA polymerase sigma-70 factor (ECF subfamily)
MGEFVAGAGGQVVGSELADGRFEIVHTHSWIERMFDYDSASTICQVSQDQLTVGLHGIESVAAPWLGTSWQYQACERVWLMSAVKPKRPQVVEGAPIEALRADDFESFYRIEASGIYRALAVTLRDRDLAEEAASEALARTFQHWDRVRTYENPMGWAYRVGMNWAISRLRRRGRHIRHPDRQEHVDAPTFDPGLQAALHELSIDQRTVVVMRYLLDLSQEEIGRVLGLPVGTVKSRLARGLSRLREEIER